MSNMKNKLKYLPVLTLISATALSGAVLMGSPVSADTTASKTAQVNVVDTSCAFTGASSSYTSTLTLAPGNDATTEGDTSKTIFQMSCNDYRGFVVQAIGSSPDATHPSGLDGNTSLYSTAGTIATGTSGANSYWAFKVNTSDPSYTSSSTTYTVAPGYTSYSVVPSTAQSIISYSNTTGNTVTGTLRTDYKVYVNSTQPSGTYTGKVKYTVSIAS